MICISVRTHFLPQARRSFLFCTSYQCIFVRVVKYSIHIVILCVRHVDLVADDARRLVLFMLREIL